MLFACCFGMVVECFVAAPGMSHDGHGEDMKMRKNNEVDVGQSKMRAAQRQGKGRGEMKGKADATLVSCHEWTRFK